jgi:tRNA (cmo5U34)-methyltransferase
MEEEVTTNNAHWNDQDSEHFIDYGNFYVPERETQIEIICSMIPPVHEPTHMIDLCCGQGLLAKGLLEQFEQSIVHGLDGSQTMLENARKTVSEHGDRFQTQLIELASDSWRKFPWPLHAVVSSLAIHHLDDIQKAQLYKDIADALRPDGVFIIADLIQPKNQLGMKVAAKGWDDAVHRRSLELSNNLDAYEFFLADKWNYYAYPESDVDKPSALFDQLKWLERAGLTDVDVFWMKAGHAIFGGRKPTL